MRKRVKGFTLIELIVVIAIIGIIAAMLIPTMTGYVQKAKVASAISSAKTIKETVESSLASRYGASDPDGDMDNAMNKFLFTDKNKKECEMVGAFTNRSWEMYKTKKKGGQLNNVGKSQKVDIVIAGGLDDMFSEEWKCGNNKNPLGYKCREYVKKSNANTNFGIVIVYDATCSVRMMQLYRKNILVTYIDGEYIANTDKNASFVGTRYWSTIYTDVGREPYDQSENLSLGRKQIGDSGVQTNWY